MWVRGLLFINLSEKSVSSDGTTNLSQCHFKIKHDPLMTISALQEKSVFVRF